MSDVDNDLHGTLTILRPTLAHNSSALNKMDMNLRRMARSGLTLAGVYMPALAATRVPT